MEIKRSVTHRDRMNCIVEYGQFVYLSGLTASGDGITAQTQNVLAGVEDLLEKAGSDKHHILRATIFLRSMELFAEMNSVWDKWITLSTTPARACVEAPLALPETLIEIVIDAVKKS